MRSFLHAILFIVMLSGLKSGVRAFSIGVRRRGQIPLARTLGYAMPAVQRIPMAISLTALQARAMSSVAASAAVEVEESGAKLEQQRTNKEEALGVSDSNKFADLPISANSRRALKDVFKYETMSAVQAETLPTILSGT